MGDELERLQTVVARPRNAELGVFSAFAQQLLDGQDRIESAIKAQTRATEAGTRAREAQTRELRRTTALTANVASSQAALVQSHRDGRREAASARTYNRVAIGIAFLALVLAFLQSPYRGVGYQLVNEITSNNVLDQETQLLPDTALKSTDNRFSLVLQRGDGNVVIYGPEGQAVYDAGQSGSGITSLYLQADCNLVGTTDSGTKPWSTGTSWPSGDPCELRMSNDGVAELVSETRGVVWSSA